MGNFFTKNKQQVCNHTNNQEQVCNHTNNQEQINTEPTDTDIKDIIKKYEYIKNKKRIADLDKLIEIMNNTDWSKTNHNYNCNAKPSAPPLQLQLHIPIAIAHVVEIVK